MKELVELSIESSNKFYGRYYKEAKKYKKGEKKKELFDRSYIHIADQFSQIHNRLIKITKEIFPNTTKYIESRNLQTILNIFKSNKWKGENRGMLEKKINGLLLAVADPFNKNLLDQYYHDTIRNELKNKFDEGYSFIKEFRGDCMNIYSFD